MIFRNFCYRIYQSVLLHVMHIIRYNNKVISGRGTVYCIPDMLEKQNIKNVLIITGHSYCKVRYV